MQDRRLLFEDASGYLRILIPSKYFPRPHEEEGSTIARLYSQELPEVTRFLVCRAQDLPIDKTWRPIWRLGDQKGPVKVEFEEAVALHRQRLKKAAEGLILDLKASLEKARVAQDLPTQVAIERTIIILTTIHEANMTHCKDLEDIKAFVPKELTPYWSYACSL